MAYDYAKVRGKIKEKFNTQEKFAKSLGISSVSLSAKLNKRIEFTQSEIDRSCELLEIPKAEIPDYFFTTKVKET